MGDAGWWSLVATQCLATASALLVASVAIRFERRKSINEALIGKRLALYDAVVPLLNDLLCFFCCIGAWRSFTPPAMIAHKRTLDRTLHVWGALFPPDLFDRWHVFSRLCFSVHNGPGRDARLRADPARLAPYWGARWDPAWNDCLAPDADASDPEAIRAAYGALVAAFADAVGVPGSGNQKEVGGAFRTRARSRRARDRGPSSTSSQTGSGLAGGRAP